MEVAEGSGGCCELCGLGAPLWHCPRCPASLCGACDAEVHLKNKILQRHERTRLQVRRAGGSAQASGPRGGPTAQQVARGRWFNEHPLAGRPVACAVPGSRALYCLDEPLRPCARQAPSPGTCDRQLGLSISRGTVQAAGAGSGAHREAGGDAACQQWRAPAGAADSPRHGAASSAGCPPQQPAKHAACMPPPGQALAQRQLGQQPQDGVAASCAALSGREAAVAPAGAAWAADRSGAVKVVGGGGGGSGGGGGGGNNGSNKPPSPPSDAAATTEGPAVQGLGGRLLAGAPGAQRA
jgi:hypothetical protein